MIERTCSKDACDRPAFARGMCKPCYRRDYYVRNKERENANFKEYREANLDREKARWAAYDEARWGAERKQRAADLAARLASPVKACTECGAEKPKEEFHLDPRRKDGRYSWCKACFHALVASSRTPETEAERRRRAYTNPETRERMRARHRAWVKANPEKNRERVNRRKAVLVAATVGVVGYGQIIERDGMVCHLCTLSIADLAGLHMDHVVPLSRGGAHSMANIKPSHAGCNLRKHNKLMSELDWVVTS